MEEREGRTDLRVWHPLREPLKGLCSAFPTLWFLMPEPQIFGALSCTGFDVSVLKALRLTGKTERLAIVKCSPRCDHGYSGVH